MKKTTSKIFVTLGLLLSIMMIFSCSNDDDSSVSTGQKHKVVYKAIGSSDVKISTIVYGYDSNTTTKTSVNTSSWTSDEIEIPENSKTINFGANGIGTTQNSSLKVEIYLDGKLVQTGTSSGDILTATATYYFK